MTKRALITGITGQDGAYLSKFLLDKGYEVFGLYRRTSSPNFWRLQAVGSYGMVQLIPGDVTDMASLLEALTISRPHELYNLAAQSFVGASFEKPLLTGDVDGLTCTRILEAVRRISPETRFYQASTSEIFGNVPLHEFPIKEETVKRPLSPYAAAKLHSHNIVNIYREAYQLYAANGILFNHESPLRGLEFVTRKITNAVARIALGLQNELVLGNLDAKRDWGFAGEYVDAMWRILQQDEPDDYVVATGKAFSVKDFLRGAFDSQNMNWEDYVVSEHSLFRPIDVNQLVGDASKAKKELKWKSHTDFQGLVTMMVDADITRWRDHINGVSFPWDAPNYPNEDHIIRRSAIIK